MSFISYAISVSTGGDGGRVPPEFDDEWTPMYLSPRFWEDIYRAIEYFATFDDAL
jgi:hypothetical protein